MEIKKRGGARKGSGPKPKDSEDLTIAITIYESRSSVKQKGGLKAIQKKFKEYYKIIEK